MDDLLEERIRSIDTEISNQNRYLQQQFEKQKRQNEYIRQVVSKIEKSLGTTVTENLVKLAGDAAEAPDGDKRTVDDSLESVEKQKSLIAASETHKNTDFISKTLTHCKHQETSLSSSPESPETTASEEKAASAQRDLHNRDVTSSQRYDRKETKHMLTTVGTQLAYVDGRVSEASRGKPSVERHESETDHSRKGYGNVQIKGISNEHATATLLRAREVSCRKEELKSSASNIWGVKKNKPASWNSFKPTTNSNNTFTSTMEHSRTISQVDDYGTDYIETCNSASCSKLSDPSSVTVFSNNDDQSDFDVDMQLSYPSGTGNAQLQYTFLVNELLCRHNCHVLNVRETRYTLTSPNGLQKKWSRIDKYRPGQKPPDLMKDLPYALVPASKPMSISGTQLPTRSPHELKELVRRSNVVVSKDISSGSPEGQLMHTLYQMKDIVGEDADIWKPIEEVIKIEVTPVPRCDKGVDTILCLDNSGTMPRQAYVQIKKLAMEFINGIEDVAEAHGLEENVGVVTLGSRATVLHHLSNDYGSLRGTIDQVECGGVPTDHCIQLQGLLVCLAAMTKGGVCTFGGRTTVPPRLLFITDGLTIGKVNQADTSHNVELFYTALDHMGTAFTRHSVVGPIQVVPYGDAKQAFISRILNRCHGNLTTIAEACNHHRLQKLSAQILDFMIKEKDGKETGLPDVDTVVAAVCSGYSQQEQKQIYEIVGDKLNEINRWLGLTDEFDNVSIKAGLPDLGTRVVRGPDWRWGNQDDGGAGTVINHGEDGESLWLSWDNGFTNVYRYGVSGNYDVLIADDPPRMIDEEGSIEIGMQVERGPDWQDISEQTDSLGVYGTVIRKRNDRVLVVWKNSTMHVYSFGEGGKYEVVIRDPLKYHPEPMPRVHTDNKLELQGAEESDSKRAKNELAADEMGDSSVWQWLGKDNKWRSYSDSNNRKLKASYKKRPGGSCLVQRDGKSFRVVFRSLVEKSIEDGTTRDVRKLDSDVSQTSE